MSLTQSIGNAVFQKIHLGNLVYNTCWEDPRCDRNMLSLNEKSRVVMLTSAGCNALDYLLDVPGRIDCVDVNPRQNALLELKLAFFKAGKSDALFDFFGKGMYPGAQRFFNQNLKSSMTDEYARSFWQEKTAHFFSGKGLRKSFYWKGTSGTVAWMMNQWIMARPSTERLVRRLFESRTMPEQQIWFDQLEPRLIGGFFKWFVSQHVIQSMLGVPKSQQQLAEAIYEDGLAGYIRECMRKVFTETSVADNYFWQLYFFGQYRPECCPNYLRPEHFETIRSQADKIHTHSSTLSQFLEENPGRYTHFVLLDHMDWLAVHNKPALEQEWELLLSNAAPGAKVLFRSASPQADFLPEWVLERLSFDMKAAAVSDSNDRVGTYASTHFATVLS
jgi:S-adenosylmethionine-diacylglycerol 3-amino-3-carboxypropyl transferase